MLGTKLGRSGHNYEHNYEHTHKVSVEVGAPPKQAQESLAAAMSLNIIVTSWADDCIETTDFKLIQPSTGNNQNVTNNLYPFTCAFKGKP